MVKRSIEYEYSVEMDKEENNEMDLLGDLQTDPNLDELSGAHAEGKSRRVHLVLTKRGKARNVLLLCVGNTYCICTKVKL